MVIQPGSCNWDDPVSHIGEEFIHCLKREFDYIVADRTFRLEHGDSLLFDSAQLHGYQNPTGLLAVIPMVFLVNQDPQLVRQIHLLA